MYKPSDGQAVNLVGKSPKAIRSLGIALSFVPEDRLGMGLVGNMDIVDNMMLRSYKRGHTAFLERKRPKDLAENIIKSLEIVTPDANTRCAACPAVMCKRCWWAERSPSTPRC